MITYLKSPRLSKFSRESILNQEEALAELDLSIDEWVAKLEQAESRRANIQERLLQHYAAALTLQTENTGTAPSSAYFEEQTPPRSPDKTLSPQTPDHRRDIQSIRVYADSDVYALLADIEQEMDLMVESKAGANFRDNSLFLA
jgi:Up-regulated During Septation